MVGVEPKTRRRDPHAPPQRVRAGRGHAAPRGLRTSTAPPARTRAYSSSPGSRVTGASGSNRRSGRGGGGRGSAAERQASGAACPVASHTTGWMYSWARSVDRSEAGCGVRRSTRAQVVRAGDRLPSEDKAELPRLEAVAAAELGAQRVAHGRIGRHTLPSHVAAFGGRGRVEAGRARGRQPSTLVGAPNALGGRAIGAVVATVASTARPSPRTRRSVVLLLTDARHTCSRVRASGKPAPMGSSIAGRFWGSGRARCPTACSPPDVGRIRSHGARVETNSRASGHCSQPGLGSLALVGPSGLRTSSLARPKLPTHASARTGKSFWPRGRICQKWMRQGSLTASSRD